MAGDRPHPRRVKLVKFGECPARCPDAEIAKLQAQVDPSNGLIRLPARPPDAIRRKISIGAKVRIAGLDAIYIGMTARQREWVLVTLLGRQVKVVVNSKTLELAELHALNKPAP